MWYAKKRRRGSMRGLGGPMPGVQWNPEGPYRGPAQSADQIAAVAQAAAKSQGKTDQEAAAVRASAYADAQREQARGVYRTASGAVMRSGDDPSARSTSYTQDDWKKFQAAKDAGQRAKNPATGQWEGGAPQMVQVGGLPFQSGRSYNADITGGVDPNAIGTAPVYWGVGKSGSAGERDILASVQNLSMLKYGGYDPKVQGGGTTQTDPRQVLYEGRYVAPELVPLLHTTRIAEPLPFEHEYVPTINAAAPVSDIMSEFAQRAVNRQWDAANLTPPADASATIPVTTSPGLTTQQDMSMQYSGAPVPQDDVPQPQQPDRAPTPEERAEFVETMGGLNHYAYGRPRGMQALEMGDTYSDSMRETGTTPPGPAPRPRPAPGPSPVPGLYPTATSVPFVGGPVQMLITQPQVSVAQLNLRNAIRAAQEKAVASAKARAEQEKARWEDEQYKIRKLQSIGGASATQEIYDIERARRVRQRFSNPEETRERQELEALIELTDVRNAQARGYADPTTWEPPVEESRWVKLWRRATRGTAVDYAMEQGLPRDAAERVGDAYVQGGAGAAKVQGYREGAPLALQAAWSGAKAAVPKIPDVAGGIWDRLKAAASSAAADISQSVGAVTPVVKEFAQRAEAKAIEVGTDVGVRFRVAQMLDAGLAAFARPTFNRNDTSQISDWATKLKLGFALTQEALIGATGDRDVSLFGQGVIPADKVLQLKQILSWADNKYGEQLRQALSEAMSQDDFDHPGRQWNGALDALRLIDRMRYDLQIVAPQNIDVARQELRPGPLKLTAPAGEYLLPGPVLVADAAPSWGSEHDIYAPAARRSSTVEDAEAAIARANAVSARADAEMRAAQIPQPPFQLPQGVVLEAQSRELPELQMRRKAVQGRAEVTVGTQAPRVVSGRAQVEVLSDAQKLGMRAAEKLGQILSGAPSSQSRIQQINQRLRETAGDAGSDFAVDQERSRLFAERGRLQRAGR